MNDSVVLILGATSDIGGEIARRLAPGQQVVLAARRPQACEQLKEQLLADGASTVNTMCFEATDFSSIETVINQASELGEIAHAVVCFGILGEHERALRNPDHAWDIATVDYTAQISTLLALAARMRTQKTTSRIYAFSSIAGWRARRANFVYGSTKSGLDAFCQGLMDELHGSKVAVTLARPGFVIGSMTAGMKPAPMSVTPADVADAVLAPRRGSATVWIPGRLRALAYVMSIVPRPVWRLMPR
ncbi:SDR family NAD(P)-dependent oxidoreductase [Corynebacterium epidermidicanis]|uniref:Short-chain alcohol dehydrogenase n=1 Tax=Corynebacterium epidermidicanis TaxID=1050174 RepID=A0A0G3GPS6_9CORY|nr:SDR family NAD(P)-dependent oxidoreductase [Corynebacterium epidermidicanis]AKK03129.1 short-chain dehydrogenase of unknown substrate specificity [Corynebacterium epidermidicanis]